MKRRWIVTAVLMGILAIGVTGGTILASTDGEDGETPQGRIMSRVAEILGLSEGQVQDAFDQARQEVHDEATQDRLAQMVERGLLTQEQADEYQEWYDTRPEGIGPGFGHGGMGGGPGFGRGVFGFGRGHGGHMRGGMGFWQGLPQAPDTQGDTSLQSF